MLLYLTVEPALPVLIKSKIDVAKFTTPGIPDNIHGVLV
jgi:hypothetical protein